MHTEIEHPRARRLARLLLTLAACLPLGGCYLVQAAGGHLDVMARREPIDVLLADSATSQKLRTRLEYVAAAREFASRDLGLPDNESYRSYADLGRPYVVWNVFAADEFSIEPRRWCFPIAGCVVYRGYFSEQRAQKYARRLRLRGYDAAVSGVAAYSTLGHFKDPVLSTMLGWSDAQLAATLFHELAHQVAYIAGDSRFNEAFATVVEEAGIERWLTTRGRADELHVWRLQRRRHIEIIELMLGTRTRLEELYRSGLPEAQLRDRKQYEFGLLKLEYARLKERWGGYSGYDRWFDRTLTNAHLISAATYYGCVPGFERLLAAVDGNLARFYETVQALAGESRVARAAKVCAADG